MNRKDIALKLEKRMDITPSQAVDAVNHIVDIITHALADGEPVFIRGFATIDVVQRSSCKGHNFANGKTVSIPAYKTLRIKTSNRLKHSINSKK